MKKFYGITLIGGLIYLFTGCQKQIDLLHHDSSGANSFLPCGKAFDTTLINYNGQISGSIRVLNDRKGIHVIIREIYTDYKINQVQLLYGTKQHVVDNIVGLMDCATMQPRNPDKVVTYNPDVDSMVVIDLSTDSLKCFYMNANITLAKRDVLGNLLHSFNIWSNGTANASQNSCQQYFQFCRHTCDSIPVPVKDTGCGQLRTQTQNSWAEKPTGNNSAAYLYAKFKATFPSGLKVGCTGGFSITMTGAGAISKLLPLAGKPERLKKNYTDPTNLKNSLVGELIALTLNVRFDQFDPNFGKAGRHLSERYIRKGTFKGKTVKEFLDIANKALGNCSHQYELSLITKTAKGINENYKNGRSDEHRLVCHVGDCNHGDDDHDDD